MSDKEKREEPKEVEGAKVVLERIYVIPLRKVYFRQRTQRAARAMRLIRKFIQRHMKAERVIIDNKVNEYVWSRGIEKPPRRVRVKAVKTEDNVVRVYLAE